MMRPDRRILPEYLAGAAAIPGVERTAFARCFAPPITA